MALSDYDERDHDRWCELGPGEYDTDRCGCAYRATLTDTIAEATS